MTVLKRNRLWLGAGAVRLAGQKSQEFPKTVDTHMPPSYQFAPQLRVAGVWIRFPRPVRGLETEFFCRRKTAECPRQGPSSSVGRARPW